MNDRPSAHCDKQPLISRRIADQFGKVRAVNGNSSAFVACKNTRVFVAIRKCVRGFVIAIGPDWLNWVFFLCRYLPRFYIPLNSISASVKCNQKNIFLAVNSIYL